MTLTARFWAKVRKSDGCWLWTGATNSKGYGCLRIGGEALLAHRVAHLALVGPIPVGQQVDHLCNVRACVRPDHLQAVTPSENNRRRPKANGPRTVCPRGHKALSVDSACRYRCDQCGWADRTRDEPALVAS